MLLTKEKKTLFKNKYIELQNNLVEDETNKNKFEHIRIIENDTNRPGSVILCKYQNSFLLIENYRYGINEVCFELPRGYVELNESLSDCAIRELYEETNIIFNKSIDKLTKLGEIAVNSSILASKVSLYLISINQIIDDVQLQSSEHIQSFKYYTLKELHEKIKEGKIIDSFTINALMLFSLNESSI